MIKKIIVTLISCAIASSTIGAISASATSNQWNNIWGDGSCFNLRYETSVVGATFYLKTEMTRVSGNAEYAMDSYVYKKNGGSWYAGTPSGYSQGWLNNNHANNEVTTSSLKGEVYYFSKSAWDECNLLTHQYCYYS